HEHGYRLDGRAMREAEALVDTRREVATLLGHEVLRLRLPVAPGRCARSIRGESRARLGRAKGREDLHDLAGLHVAVLVDLGAFAWHGVHALRKQSLCAQC